jgi:DNA helicase-2/ATP-dependent DNA helicase PcrA
MEHGEGPLVVFAGAGSGKTMVITHRVANLVLARGVAPWRVLAVTFTNKAAGEMRERLDRLLPDGAGQLWIGTFHATCARLLRRFAGPCGVKSDFAIYDEVDQRAVLARLGRDLGLDERVYPPEFLARHINRAKQEGTGLEYGRRLGPSSGVFEQVYEGYEERLERAGALDFGDLIYRLVRAMRANQGLKRELQGLYDQVLVDEFQDTNRVQFELVAALCAEHRNLCVVGDDDQSIYRWRGADRRNILDFRRSFPDATVVKLEQNYRSTRRILRAATSVVKRNQEREPKTLWTENEEGDAVALLCCEDERGEADAFVRLVRRELDDGRSRSEIALLYRVHAQSRVFEEALRAADIAYRVVGGIRFYDRAEVKDLLAYLRALGNPGDDVSLLRIINTPGRGIGQTTVNRVLEEASSARTSVWEALGRVDADRRHGTAARKKIGAFVELVDSLTGLAGQGCGPAELCKRVLAETGYQKALEAQDSAEADAKLQNIQELLDSMTQYEQSDEEPTLSGYLELVTLQTDADRSEQADSLAMMTVHAAKGLEFPVVVVAGLEEGNFPHLMGEKSRDREALEEERRLAYVAFTRAREKLYLSHARSRFFAGQRQERIRSRFIEEMPLGELQIAETGRPRSERYGWQQRPRPWEWEGGAGTGPKRGRQPRTTRGDSYVDRSEYSDLPPEELLPGARVRHKTFGPGLVIKIRPESGSVIVKFAQHGTRTILAGFLEPD